MQSAERRVRAALAIRQTITAALLVVGCGLGLDCASTPSSKLPTNETMVISAPVQTYRAAPTPTLRPASLRLEVVPDWLQGGGTAHFKASITGDIKWCPDHIDWDFGDGSLRGRSAKSYTVACDDRGPWREDHLYSEPRHYIVRLRVFEFDQEHETGSVAVSVDVR